MSVPDSLDLFSPVLADWFRRRVGKPTAVQNLAWPRIAAGENVLVSAPTGSGKTLTAFLWSLDKLFAAEQDAGSVPDARPLGIRVLYVSPLKALGTDIRNNLTGPLEELRQAFGAAGRPVPAVSVATRSGDTPAADRQRMLRRPPDILITTPESLNLMISSRRPREILAGVQTVILDEIHAVVASRRGVHLMTAIERLGLIAGDFQRIALSATVRPLEPVAEFVGGLVAPSAGDPLETAPRPVRIVEAPREKEYSISVHFPLADALREGRMPLPGRSAAGAAKEQESGQMSEDTVWEAIVEELRARILDARSTLVFTNNRRLSEQLARMLNDAAPGSAYAHHGSLSRELRRVVEHRLKKGELAAVVATSSLELGIDVGDLDQVLLVQTPRSIASAIQRVGRAGHGVGQLSVGRLYPTHGRDLLEAAVVGRAIREGAIEPIHPVHGALDVLAQVILAMLGVEDWSRDELFAFFRSCYSYRELSERHFDLVLDMLRGRYEGTRIRELRPRISFNETGRLLRAREGVQRLIWSAGGTIPDRGYFDLRTGESRARIGSLDEEFVWERSLGDTFIFGAGTWRITNITHNDVEVVPAGEATDLLPFWRAEALNRSYFLSERIAAFLESAEGIDTEAAAPAAFADRLRTDYGMDRASTDALVDWIRRQQAATGKLPTRSRIVLEQYRDPAAVSGATQLILHTHWGGRVNRPLALALIGATQKATGLRPEYFANDDCVNLLLPQEVEFQEILDELQPDSLLDFLRAELEATGFFGARFRENAGRALLLPRAGFRQRTPLWQTRRRAKKLLEDVRAFADFPLVVETWRSCLNDEFDLEHLQELYGRLHAGEIELHAARTSAPSPFAADVIWRQVNEYMYADDRPISRGTGESISGEIFREMVAGTRLRPRIASAVIEELEGRLQRLAVGYAPTTGAELYDWLSERVALPLEEWERLTAAVERDSGRPASELLEAAGLADRMERIELEDGMVAVVSRAREAEFRAARAGPAAGETEEAGEDKEFGEGEEAFTALVAEWLQFYGPIEPESGARLFGHAVWSVATDGLLQSAVLIADVFRDGPDAPAEICDAENLEILLRMARRRAAPRIETRPAGELPWFLARWQGLADPREDTEGLQRSLEQLFGFAAPAALWESEILPARLRDYRPGVMDGLFQESDLVWYGSGREKIAFAFPEDLDLFREREAGDANAGETEEAGDGAVVGNPANTRKPIGIDSGRYDFSELQSRSGLSSAELTERIWSAVWQGEISNTTMTALRRGLVSRFRPAQATRGRGRWQTARPMPGLWFALPEAARETDAFTLEEDRKQKARQLLERYGVLFRELVAHEVASLRWSEIFRALRIMELSGEIVAGYFFEGPAGPQFMSPAALRAFREGSEPRLYWISAVDPASPCGLGLDGLRSNLPRRLPGNHLVYHGSELLLVSVSRGKRLHFLTGPDDERLPECLKMFSDWLREKAGRVRSVRVESVNEEAAAASPYAVVMRAFGFRKEMNFLSLDRSHDAR